MDFDCSCSMASPDPVFNAVLRKDLLLNGTLQFSGLVSFLVDLRLVPENCSSNSSESVFRRRKTFFASSWIARACNEKEHYHMVTWTSFPLGLMLLAFRYLKCKERRKYLSEVNGGGRIEVHCVLGD